MVTKGYVDKKHQIFLFNFMTFNSLFFKKFFENLISVKKTRFSWRISTPIKKPVLNIYIKKSLRNLNFEIVYYNFTSEQIIFFDVFSHRPIAVHRFIDKCSFYDYRYFYFLRMSLLLKLNNQAIF